MFVWDNAYVYLIFLLKNIEIEELVSNQLVKNFNPSESLPNKTDTDLSGKFHLQNSEAIGLCDWEIRLSHLFIQGVVFHFFSVIMDTMLIRGTDYGI